MEKSSRKSQNRGNIRKKTQKTQEAHNTNCNVCMQVVYSSWWEENVKNNIFLDQCVRAVTSHEKWRKRLQPDSLVVGGQCHIISQQTNSKQEEEWDQACFQDFAKVPPGDCRLLFHSWTLSSYFLILIITTKLRWSLVQSRNIKSHKMENCVTIDWRLHLQLLEGEW